MKSKKKRVEITGNMLLPVTVGQCALIDDHGKLRTTTRVLRAIKLSKKEIRFETQNMKYVLHLLSATPLVKWHKEVAYQ